MRGDEERAGNRMVTKLRNAAAVEPWMVSPDGLALRRNRCPAVLYAAIYEATGDGAGHFAETAVAFSDMHGFNRHTFQDARDRLLAAGLIERVLDEEGRPVKIRRPGRPVYLLRVNLDAAREAKERFGRAFGESAPAAVAAPAEGRAYRPLRNRTRGGWTREQQRRRVQATPAVLCEMLLVQGVPVVRPLGGRPM